MGKWDAARKGYHPRRILLPESRKAHQTALAHRKDDELVQGELEQGLVVLGLPHLVFRLVSSIRALGSVRRLCSVNRLYSKGDTRPSLSDPNLR